MTAPRPDVKFEFWFGEEAHPAVPTAARPLVRGRFTTKVAFDHMTPDQWGAVVNGVQDLIYQYEKYEP